MTFYFKMSTTLSLEQLELRLSNTPGRVLVTLSAIVLLDRLLVRYVASEPSYHVGIPIAGLRGPKSVKGLAQARRDWDQFGKHIIDQGLTKVCSLRNLPENRSSANACSVLQLLPSDNGSRAQNSAAQSLCPRDQEPSRSPFWQGYRLSMYTKAFLDKRILINSQQFFGSYPGFDPFGHDSSSQVIVDTVRGKLTQSLSKSIISRLKDRHCANKRFPRLHN